MLITVVTYGREEGRHERARDALLTSAEKVKVLCALPKSTPVNMIKCHTTTSHGFQLPTTLHLFNITDQYTVTPIPVDTGTVDHHNSSCARCLLGGSMGEYSQVVETLKFGTTRPFSCCLPHELVASRGLLKDCLTQAGVSINHNLEYL